MAENSGIEWTDHTFNPWWGCAKVSPGCDHCYAERDAGRFAAGTPLWGVDAHRLPFGDKHWNLPLRWNRQAEKAGNRRRVFCASMADVFDKNAPEGARERLWALIRQTPHLDWLILTKRIGNAKSMLPGDWGLGYQNVWMGSSVINQDEADRDVPKLLSTPACVRFLSCEPLLGPIDLTKVWVRMPGGGQTLWNTLHGRSSETPEVVERTHIDWVIVGGESGPRARPMDIHWARSIRHQCENAGVAFFFKQGSQAKWADFKNFEGFPAVLQVRDWPRAIP